jgi:hypothetical protein
MIERTDQVTTLFAVGAAFAASPHSLHDYARGLKGSPILDDKRREGSGIGGAVDKRLDVETLMDSWQ